MLDGLFFCAKVVEKGVWWINNPTYRELRLYFPKFLIGIDWLPLTAHKHTVTSPTGT